MLVSWIFTIKVGYNRLYLNESYFCTKGTMVALYTSGSGRVSLNYNNIYPDYIWLSTTYLERICMETNVGIYVNALIDSQYKFYLINAFSSYAFEEESSSQFSVMAKYDYYSDNLVAENFYLTNCKFFIFNDKYAFF